MKYLLFNGVHENTGKAAARAQASSELKNWLAGRSPLLLNRAQNGRFGNFLKQFQKRTLSLKSALGEFQLTRPIQEQDLQDIGKVGWGILYPEEHGAELLKQLLPLRALRRQQAGARYREVAYRRGRRLGDLFPEVDRVAGPVENSDLPYYWLIIGKPTEIPFDLQYSLDRNAAVGRIAFERQEDYGRYARNVVNHEFTRTAKLKTTLFGSIHPGDLPSSISSTLLVKRLGQRMKNTFSKRNFDFDIRLGANASKSNLIKIIKGVFETNLLFTVTHGLIAQPHNPEFNRLQGSLICADWPGPQQWREKPIPSRMTLSGHDIGEDTALNGMIAFIYACYGGGTPKFSSFPLEPGGKRKREANRPFVGFLPQKMLAAENGCRAVIAQVDTAFVWSFTNDRKEERSEPYQIFFRKLLEGHTVGSAFNIFQDAHLEKLGSYLELVDARNSGDLHWDDDRLIQAWFGVNNLRNFIILGDPAVRLPRFTD